MHFDLNKTGSLINEMIQDIKSGEDSLFAKWSIYNPYFTLDNILESMMSTYNLFTNDSIKELLHFTNDIDLSGKSVLIIVNEVKPLELLPTLIIFRKLKVLVQVNYLSGSALIYKELFKYFKSKEVDIFNDVVFLDSVATKTDFYVYMHGGDINSSLASVVEAKGGYVQKVDQNDVCLTGNEGVSDLNRLAKCITTYFGRSNHNVRKVFVPKGYDFTKLCSALAKHSEMCNTNRYANNLDYNRSVYLMNKMKFYDAESVIIKEDRNNKPPVSVIYYEYYDSIDSNISGIDNVCDKLFNLKWRDYWHCNSIFNNLYIEKNI
ncbi:MAG: hypothetical protein N4A72_01180 [Bacteroidales bacterium]|jgi:hypothetical protein|nr:hypothetical protein [Bacteroidales bacterium]